MHRRIRLQTYRPLGFKSWLTIILALILTAGILVAVAVIALGTFLIVLPVLIVALVVYALFPKRKRPPGQRHAEEPAVVDGEFRVVDSGEADRSSSADENQS